MPVKLTMHFRNTTEFSVDAPSSRTAAWTESHFVNADTIAGADAIVRNAGKPVGGAGILDFRAALLAQTGSIVKYTLTRYANPVAGMPDRAIGSPAIFLPRSAPFGGGAAGAGLFGPADEVCDIPQQGVMIEAELAAPHTQSVRFILRGIPNGQIATGEYIPNGPYRGAMRNYLGALAGFFGTMIDRRDTAATAGQAIDTISVAGVVKGKGNITVVAEGDVAVVTRTTNSDGRQTGGKYTVTADGPGAGEVTMGAWDRGVTTGGLIRKWERAFATYRPLRIIEVGQATKKVGSARDYKARNRRRR